MNPITAQNSSLAGVLADLASQTQPAGDFSTANAADQGIGSASSGSDVLVISGSASETEWTGAVQDLGQEKKLSALADSSSASAANKAAWAMMSGDASGPLAAQGNLDPGSVLSLLQEN